jgi:hypothetical protein
MDLSRFYHVNLDPDAHTLRPFSCTRDGLSNGDPLAYFEVPIVRLLLSAEMKDD